MYNKTFDKKKLYFMSNSYIHPQKVKRKIWGDCKVSRYLEKRKLTILKICSIDTCYFSKCKLYFIENLICIIQN
jgi:hypothetical protein